MSGCACSPSSPHSEFLTLPQVAALLGRGGKRPSTTTIWRWCRKGCKGVMLEHVRLGRELRITEAALADFGRRLAEVDRPTPTPTAPTATTPRPPSARRRARDVEAAKETLRREGVL